MNAHQLKYVSTQLNKAKQTIDNGYYIDGVVFLNTILIKQLEYITKLFSISTDGIDTKKLMKVLDVVEDKQQENELLKKAIKSSTIKQLREWKTDYNALLKELKTNIPTSKSKPLTEKGFKLALMLHTQLGKNIK